MEHYAHPKIKKLWKLATEIAFIFILKIVGIDLLQVVLDSLAQDYSSTKLLFESSIVVLTSTAILLIASSFIRMELRNPIETIKIGKSTKLQIKLPDEFIQNEDEKHDDSVYYFNPINDDYFIITIEEKYLFEEDLMLNKYGEMIISVIADGKMIDIKEIKMVKENIYELNLIINKVRYCGLVKILETNNEFLTVRVFSGIKNYTVHKNKYLEMLDSISI